MAKIDLDSEINSIRNRNQITTPDLTGAGYTHTFTKADGLYVVDENGLITGPIGSGGLPANKGWIVDTATGLDYPASPDSMDDEFEDETLDAKWTIWNNPTGENALSTTKYPGQIHVGMVEAATHNTYASYCRVYQTPPAGGAFELAFKARLAVSQIGGAIGHEGEDGVVGRWGGVGLYLGNSANSEIVGCQIELNPIPDLDFPFIFKGRKGVNDNMDNQIDMQLGPLPGGYLHFKLEKTTTAAYTSANTYKVYLSIDGLIWYESGYQNNFTFTASCDEVGIYFRHPSVQDGDVIVYPIADYFRRIS